MKKFVVNFLYFISLLCVIIAGGENSDGGPNVVWTLSWLLAIVAICVVAQLLSKKWAIK